MIMTWTLLPIEPVIIIYYGGGRGEGAAGVTVVVGQVEQAGE